MLTKKTGFFTGIRPLTIAIALFAGGAVYAQDEGPTPPQLLKEAMQLMQAEKYDDAIGVMYMYIDAVAPSKAPRVVAIAQDMRYKLATILIKQGRQDEAAAVLEDYVKLPLAVHMRQALKMLATCHYEAEAYQECVTAVTNALWYNENPVVISKTVVMGDEGEEEEVDTRKLDLEEPDPEYSVDDITTLNMTLAESYYGLQKWAECVEPFTYVIQNTDNEQRRGYAIMQIVNALIEMKAYDRILEWVPQLYRTSARYDIRVNLALMKAAAALYSEGEYDAALPLYRMIMPREELLEYQRKQLRSLRESHGMAPEEGAEMSEAEKLLFGIVDEKPAEGETAAAPQEPQVPKEILELESLIATLEGLPPYENDIDYRMAELYKDVERYWEGFHFFDKVYKIDPVSDIGERSIYELVSTLLENLEEVEEAKVRGYDYLSKYKEGMTPRQIAYMFTGYYQSTNDMAAMKTLLPLLDSMVRTNDEAIVKYDTELYFMQGVADLILQNYSASEAGFKRVLDEFPNSHQEANAQYWYSMSQMFLQKYAEALPGFERYIKDFPTDSYIDESYFQAGVCMFGLEQYDAASNQFSYVINTYPDSSIFPEANSMRGDIYGSLGMLDEACADYERADKAADRVNQSTYAVFQMAAIYEAEDKYDDILRVVESYITRWDDKADVAKALFWIGKTKIQQGKPEEAVSTYLDAIVKYGGDLRQDGVDLMIGELVKISNIYLDTKGQEQLMADLKVALEAASEQTLQLRLRVAIAKLERTEVELGKQLIKELPNLDNASPPVLAVICDASFEMKDYSRAEEMLMIFITKFEDSDYMRAAYKLRAYGQYEAEDYEGVKATINDAQALYGTDPDVAWAQLMKARVLLAEDDFEGARKENTGVFGVPTWRGEPNAQAMYQLGQVEEAAGNLKQAHAYYQRTYFQFKGHGGGYWAAEGYLSAARTLKKLGLNNDMRNTYRAMLFDPYVNKLPQSKEAREVLGREEVAEIIAFIATGGTTNITVSVETDEAKNVQNAFGAAPEEPEETPEEMTETSNEMDEASEEMNESGEAATETEENE